MIELKILSNVYKEKVVEDEIHDVLYKRDVVALKLVDVKDIAVKNRWKLILDYDNKKDIATDLNISVASLGNNLSSLRKKGIIIDNKVVSNLLVYPGKEFKLTFKFKVSD